MYNTNPIIAITIWQSHLKSYDTSRNVQPNNEKNFKNYQIVSSTIVWNATVNRNITDIISGHAKRASWFTLKVNYSFSDTF